MTNNQLTKERLEKIKSWRETYGAGSNVMLPAEEAGELARVALAAMDSEPKRNPVLAYADSYRDMAKQGVQSVPIWSVINDLERNIAPLYRHAQPAPAVVGEPVAKKVACWSCQNEVEISAIGDCDGYCPNCNSPIDLDEEPYTAPQSAPDRGQVRREHAEWSQATFGNVGPVGPLKHLRKEALEAAAEPDDLSEWADMQFLLWDAQRRAGITDEQITQAMIEKLAVNKQRDWPEPKDGEPRLHIKAQSAPVVVDFKKLACELVDNLVDRGGLDEGVEEQYLKWVEETCCSAMLACTPQEIPVAPEKIEQSRKKVDRCDVCTEGVRGGCGTCAFNGNL